MQMKLGAQSIPGLSYIQSYISPQEEALLLQQIDSSPWLNDLQRRVQHYGYKYDYQTKSINHNHYLGELPDYLLNICKKMQQDQLIKKIPNQVIINEYQPGQGISAHIDHTSFFDSTICSLSLGSACVMKFSNQSNSNQSREIEMLLEPMSLLILTNEARYNWKHSIAPRKIDKYEDNGSHKIIYRKRRVSLTFRNRI